MSILHNCLGTFIILTIVPFIVMLLQERSYCDIICSSMWDS